MNAEIINIIAEGKHPDLMHPSVALTRLEDFLREHRAVGQKKIPCAGKNFQGFDKPFLVKNATSLDKLFHHRTLDPVTSYTRKTDIEPPDLKLCLERAEITLPFKLHTAVDDAKAVICLVRDIVGKSETRFKDCNQ